MRHYTRFDSLSATETRHVLRLAAELKKGRGQASAPRPFQGQTWGLIFNKSSTRTRVSFEVGLRELGAQSLFLSAADIQLGRGEPMRDTARVLGRMMHGAVIRTYAQSDVEEFAKLSGIPTINALTDEEHPCQILADIFTVEERKGPMEKQKVVFIGDAACNVPLSWVAASRQLGFPLVLCAPEGYQPPVEALAGAPVTIEPDPLKAAEGADVLYTDVWVSMGKESEKAQRMSAMKDYQINASMLAVAKPEALVMHCLPAYRGLEISEEVFELHADTIFQEAENRLHAQKGLLYFLHGENSL